MCDLIQLKRDEIQTASQMNFPMGYLAKGLILEGKLHNNFMEPLSLFYFTGISDKWDKPLCTKVKV